jgi:hypothetical protein
VAFAGSAIWLPRELRTRLRSYAVSGGRVASFGADAFRRTVALGDATLGPAAAPRPMDVFGERTEPQETGSAPMEVFQDDLGLFGDLSPLIGDFTTFETSVRLPGGSRLLSSAGRDLDQPAFVAYRLGDGLVLRSGSAEWARQLDESQLGVEVPKVTQRIWRLLVSSG